MRILIFFLLLTVNLSAQKRSEVTHLAALEFESQLIKADSNQIIIVDVRTAGEYQQGHLEKAILINYFGKGFRQKIKQLDSSKVVYVYCHSGIRSGLALSALRKRHFPHIYNLKGGTAALETAHRKATQ